MKKLLRFHNHHSVFTRGSRKIEYIPVEMIRPSPYQPRKSFSLKGLEELAQSIKQYGVIQPYGEKILPEAMNNAGEKAAGRQNGRSGLHTCHNYRCL